MAELTQDPFPLPDYGSFGSYDAYDEAEKEAIRELDDPIVTFPRADGAAIYRVVDFEHVEPCECCGRGGEPLLQHVPYGDAWSAAASTIRGFTTEEAKKMAVDPEDYFYFL